MNLDELFRQAALKLATLPGELANARAVYVNRKAEMIEFRYGLLATRREAYEAALTDSKARAYKSPLINGKNQAERDAQLDAWLADDAPTRDSKAAFESAQKTDAMNELGVEQAEVAYKNVYHDLQAAQSLASLLVAWRGEEAQPFDTQDARQQARDNAPPARAPKPSDKLMAPSDGATRVIHKRG